MLGSVIGSSHGRFPAAAAIGFALPVLPDGNRRGSTADTAAPLYLNLSTMSCDRSWDLIVTRPVAMHSSTATQDTLSRLGLVASTGSTVSTLDHSLPFQR